MIDKIKEYSEQILQNIQKEKIASVLDIGCSYPYLFEKLYYLAEIRKLNGMSSDLQHLEWFQNKMGWPTKRSIHRQKIELFAGSLLYKDPRHIEYELYLTSLALHLFEPAKLTLVEENLFTVIYPQTLYYLTFTYKNTSAIIEWMHRIEKNYPYEWQPFLREKSLVFIILRRK